MNPFFPFTSAHSSFWSVFATGPLGLAAQFFLDPQAGDASTALEEQPEKTSQGIDKEARSICDTSDVPVHTSVPPVRQFPQDISGPQWLSSRFHHHGLAHNFKIYVPRSYDGRPQPMIVMLHGAQQDPDDFAIGTQMNAVAEEQGYVVVYPEQSEGTNPLRCWNWFRPGDRTLESGETAMLVALTREITTMYNIDKDRVYVAGMSAGGAMAVNLVVTHPDLFAAAAIHSGIAFGVADEPLAALCAMNDGKGQLRLPEIFSDGDRLRVVPLIVFHGDADEVVHPRNSDQITAMRRLLVGALDDTQPPVSIEIANVENCHAYTRHVFRDQGGLPVGEQWLVHGLGHAWSGGHAGGTHTDARGPHATQEIIRFFGQFALGL